MKKIDWVSKLTSRKFWMSLASFVTMLVTAFGVAEGEAAQVSALIMAGASVIAYVIGEGLTDASRTTTTVTVNKDETEGTTEGEVQ